MIQTPENGRKIIIMQWQVESFRFPAKQRERRSTAKFGSIQKSNESISARLWSYLVTRVVYMIRFLSDFLCWERIGKWMHRQCSATVCLQGFVLALGVQI